MNNGFIARSFDKYHLDSDSLSFKCQTNVKKCQTTKTSPDKQKIQIIEILEGPNNLKFPTVRKVEQWRRCQPRLICNAINPFYFMAPKLTDVEDK